MNLIPLESEKIRNPNALMLAGKNKIKFVSSLKIKKFRDENRQFIIEGDKIVRDTLAHNPDLIKQIYATPEWINYNTRFFSDRIEVFETELALLSRASSFDSPPQVIALVDYFNYVPDYDQMSGTLSIALDTIQDPGNMGTIIRTADWFGISDIFCSEGCAELYNQKVIQASMGAALNVKVHYVDLNDLLNKALEYGNYTVAGTFMKGISLYDTPPIQKGLLIFGNESRGISESLHPLLKLRLTIPAAGDKPHYVESLNVASSVAITLSALKSK